MHCGPPSLRSFAFLLIVFIAVAMALTREAATAAAPTDGPLPAPIDSPDLASVVGPDGGSVATPDARITVTVPAGALSEETRVLLSSSNPVRASSTILEFDLVLAAVSRGAMPKLSAPVTADLKLTDNEVRSLGDALSGLSLNKADPVSGEWVAASADTNADKDIYGAILSGAGHYALNTPESSAPQTAASRIDPASGGVLESPDGVVRLDFPQNATDEKINAEYRPIQKFAAENFTIVRQFELIASADIDGSQVTTFGAPISLTVKHSSEDLAGLSYDNLTLYWRDEAKDQWVAVPNQINDGGIISAPLTHFSVYATGTSSYIAGPGRILWHQGDQHAGAATYTIPIPLLPGPGGFKPPDPNLTYNSARVDEMKSANAMGSIVGIGWEINLPAIFRDPATGRYYLQIDGATDELIQTGTEGTATTWSTRNEQYRRIRSKTVAGQHAVFIVTQKDGTQFRFGTTTDLDTPVTTLQRWYWTWDQTNGWKQEFYQIDIGRVIDTRGNYADYMFTQSLYAYCPPGAPTPCPNTVKDSAPWYLYWGANLNADNTHKFRVYFYSINLGRSDAPTCNVPPVLQTRKLNALILQVLNGGVYTTSKNWVFSYSVANGDCSGAGAFKLTSTDVRGTDSSTLQTYNLGYGSSELAVDYKSSTQSCRALTWPYLQSASNGFGATTTFTYEYKWQAGSAGTDPACAGSSTVGTWSRQVVSSRTENPGVGTPMTHTFAYTTGPNYYYPAGLNPIDAEYRGFREVRDTDGLGDYTICAYYTTGWESETGYPGDALTGHPFRCTPYESTGSSPQNQMMTWIWRSISANANFVYLASNLTYWGSEYLETRFSYDSYGNNTWRSDHPNSYSPYRAYQTQFSPNTTAWIVGLPAAQVTYRVDPNPPYWIAVDKTTYIYDNKPAYTDPPDKGDLTKEARYDEADVAHIRVVYGYDIYGNRMSETRYRDGSPSLTKTIILDATYHTYLAIEVVTSVTPNQTTSYAYDFVLGKRITTTDPNGQQWNTRYDPHGRIDKEWSPGDSENYPTVHYEYNSWDTNPNPPNQTVTQRLEQSGTTNVLMSWEWFDGLERSIQTRAEGPDCSQDVGVTDTVYDAAGNIASRSIPYAHAGSPNCGDYGSDPNKPKTQYAYDVLGRQTMIANFSNSPPSLREITYAALTETDIDENFHKTERVKDALGRVVTVKEYSGDCGDPYCYPPEEPYALYATTTFEYDVLDRQARVTDTFGNQSVTNYNMLGFVTSTVDPDRGVWTYTYYDDGLLKTRNDARTPTAQTITYTYDSLSRITGKTYSGYSSPSPVSYFYDQTPDTYPNGAATPAMPDGYPIGRLTRILDWAGEHLHSYDGRGRETDERHIIQSATYDVGHSFDSLDREYCTAYPDGEKVGTTFDTQGVVETLEQYPGAGCGGTPTATYLTSTTYNAASLPATLAYGNGLNVAYGYRSSDWRLSSITAGSLLNYSYGYDAKGNITTIHDSTEGPQGTTQTLAYDHRDRLDRVNGLSATIDYTDNEIGNLTMKQEGASNYTSMTYPSPGNPRPHAVTQANYPTGYHTFQYDANGNMTGEYDNALNPVHEFAYNAEGLTSSRTSTGQSPATVSYEYDAQGTLARKIPSGESGTVYIGGVYEKNTQTAEVVKYYLALGASIAMRRGSSRYYLTHDHLGGTALVTDENRNMISRIRYFPYGGVRTFEGTNPPPTDKLFTGQQRETTNGIYHYKARLYNADIGRMPQPDSFVPKPIDPQAYDRYAYVNNNPLTLVDPTGYFSAFHSVSLYLQLQGLGRFAPYFRDLLAWERTNVTFQVPAQGNPVATVRTYAGTYTISEFLSSWRIAYYMQGVRSDGRRAWGSVLFDWSFFQTNSGVAVLGGDFYLINSGYFVDVWGYAVMSSLADLVQLNYTLSWSTVRCWESCHWETGKVTGSRAPLTSQYLHF